MSAGIKFKRLEDALGHFFNDPKWLELALTHRSRAHEVADRGHPKGHNKGHNERLEFLGDAVLGMATTMLLWQAFPEASEGELTRKRAALVSERSLASIARELGIGALLILGKGEEKTGGRDKSRLLASSLEAILGAILLDSTLLQAVTSCQKILNPWVTSHTENNEDFKSQLQEHAQSLWGQTPKYRLDRTEGPDHAKTFHISVMLGQEKLAEGSGRSKSEAEQNAAHRALKESGA